MKNIQQGILELLKKGNMSRPQLSFTLGIPRSTIYDNLIVLEIAQIVERYKPEIENPKQSRPIIKWRLR